jgi:hypothetical protein
MVKAPAKEKEIVWRERPEPDMNPFAQALSLCYAQSLINSTMSHLGLSSKLAHGLTRINTDFFLNFVLYPCHLCLSVSHYVNMTL